MKPLPGSRAPGPATAAAAGNNPGSPGLYRIIFEQARDSILVLELPPGGVPVIRDANPAALILHGFSREDLVGKPVTVLGASLNRSRLARGNGGSGAAFEVRQKRRDGTPLITEVTARNINFGSMVYGVLIERDVTPRRRQEEEGRRLSGLIMMAREAEKKRLAASLHDAIGAMQVGLSAELLLMEEELCGRVKCRVLPRIGQARKLLKKVTAGFKAACVESWPPALAVSGLAAVLRELVSGFSRRSDIAVSQNIRLDEATGVSESPLAIVLYRLAQEALNNAEKHSGAKKVDFAVSCENGWMTLSVRDDGRGFDMARAKNKKTSLGLKIMAETAGSAGGYFSVYSKPGEGTHLKAELPLCPEPAGEL